MRSDRTIVCLTGVGGAPSEWAAATPLLRRIGRIAAALPPDGRVVLVGHSQGGVRALRIAVAEPHRVEALVLTSSFFPPARNGRPTVAAVLDFARHRAQYLVEVVARGRRVRPTRRGAGRLRSMLPLALRPDAYHRLAGSVGCPVLVVHGDCDHLVPVAFARAACARHPGWTYREFAGAGHHLHRDRAAEWAGVVGGWLDAVLAEPAGR